MAVQVPYRRAEGPLNLLVDSTGIKFLGDGEWQARKHGVQGRRQWRKVHLAMDPATSDIRAVEFTPNSKGDSPVLPELLDQIPEAEQIGTVTADGAYDTRRCHNAISVLFPTSACHGCRGTVDRVRAREEDLQRSDPAEYEWQKTEAYVRGADNPAPAVVTLTSEAATMAVNELIAGLVDFRGTGGWTWQRYRKLDKGFERPQAAQPRPDCPICGSEEYWGLGDIEPFLDRIG